MEEWKTYTLGELITLNSGGTPDKNNKSYWEGDIPWISAKFMYNDYLYSSELKISQEGLDNGSRLAPKGSILLLTRGSGLFNRIPVCYVMRDLAYNQDVKCIESNNEELVSTKFLFYWLMGNKNSICAILETTGIGAGKIDTNRLKNIRVSLPPKEYQQALIGFAESVMHKIELNRRINDNLEQQAQALFDHYFDSKVLEGSTHGFLTDIAIYLNGLAMQKFPAINIQQSLPVLKIKELGQRKCDSSCDRCSNTIDTDYVIDNGDIIFSWSGTLLVDVWCGGKCGLNQHLFKVTPLNNYPRWFVYYWTNRHLERFKLIAKDKAVTMGHIKRGDLENAEVTIPTKSKMLEIDAQIKPLFQSMIDKRLENSKLEDIRDALLPKLMSGKISSDY